MSPWNRPGSTGSRSGTCWKTASRSSWSTRRKAKGVGSRIDSAPDAFPLPYQETHYVYGVTTAGGSGVNSNDILSATQYPDPYSDQLSSQLDTYLANALGDVVQSTDRNGTVHQSSYDTLGRLTSDAVTTLGTGVDGTVRRITYGYDSQGNPSLITSYNAASGGSIVNQVQRVYNGLGQLTGEYQSHSGAVVQGSTPEVQYAYNEMSNGENNSRLVSMTYPNGYTLNYNYSSGLNDGISRLSSLSDSSGTLESYLYLGLNTVVERDHPQTGINLSYLKQSGDTQYNGDGGDQYTGLDRFGRVIDQFWINASNGTTVDRYQYGYDPDSEVLYRQNLVDAAMSELYSYDKLGQLASFQRGTLNSSHNGIVGTPSRSQIWTPDALGNFTNVATNGTAQTRTANQQNEYTSISGSGTVSYDANGNTTADGTGNSFVYDAWDRLVAIKNGSTTLASYTYDGLNRQIQVTEGGTTTDLYVSAADQVLAEYQGSTVTAYNVWSPVYVNALVFRAVNQGSWQRLYAVQDANWNVTALVNGTAAVVERYAYDPYGAITVMSPSWVVQSSSNYDVPDMWQGMRYDWTTNLYITVGRDISPTLMRPLQTDPLGLGPDVNPYRWEGNGPVDSVDPLGLVKLFGQEWVAPWDPNASWNVWGGVQQYANAVGVAVSGTAAGAGTGAGTGVAAGSAVGGAAGLFVGGPVAAGPAALAGAGVGLVGGGTWGGVSGFIESINADDALDAAKRGAKAGAITGLEVGATFGALEGANLAVEMAEAAKMAKTVEEAAKAGRELQQTERALEAVQGTRCASTTNFVTNEGVPASRVGTGRAVSIYGEGEAAGAGFTDVATEAQFANGRPLTSTLPNRSASDLALRDAPLSATTRAELQRLAQPGARITYSNADVEGFQTYVDQLRQTFPNAKVVQQGTVTGANGVQRGVVVLELP